MVASPRAGQGLCAGKGEPQARATCAGCQHACICREWQCRWEACVRVRVGCVQILTESQVTITPGVCASFSTTAATDVKVLAGPAVGPGAIASVDHASSAALGLGRCRVCTRVPWKTTHSYGGVERKRVCRGRTGERAPLIVVLPSCLNFVIRTLVLYQLGKKKSRRGQKKNQAKNLINELSLRKLSRWFPSCCVKSNR